MPKLIHSSNQQAQNAEDDSLSTFFQINSYGSMDVMDNLGSTSVFIAIFIVRHFLAIILGVFAKYSTL